MNPCPNQLLAASFLSLLLAVSSSGGDDGPHLSDVGARNKDNHSPLEMGSKGYVGMCFHDLEARGICLSGTKVCQVTTQTIQSVSFSVTATNISRIALAVRNSEDDTTLIRSEWRADQDNVCRASFLLDGKLFPEAHLYFDYDRHVSGLYSADGCCFDLQNYTDWDSVLIELESE